MLWDNTMYYYLLYLFILFDFYLFVVFINPINLLLWTFRRSAFDVINLYNSLSPLMQLAAESNMLNFGYWSHNVKSPNDAQQKLTEMVGDLSELNQSKTILDVGSGFSAPAMIWKENYKHLKIFCINLNYKQLFFSKKLLKYNKYLNCSYDIYDICLINSTSLNLPFVDQSIDVIISLESAQHFKPFSNFIDQSFNILKNNGLLVIAVPVINPLFANSFLGKVNKLFKLGIISLTWTSEHYFLDELIEVLKDNRFNVVDVKKIGSSVYDPLSDYYISHRKEIKKKIIKQYGFVIEQILYRSIKKMNNLSKNKIIDYVIIKAIKE